MLVPSVTRLAQHFIAAHETGDTAGGQRTANNFPCAPPSFQEICDHGFAGSSEQFLDPSLEKGSGELDHLDVRSAGSHFDPNSCVDDALFEWLARSDVATWPHVLRCVFIYSIFSVSDLCPLEMCALT